MGEEGGGDVGADEGAEGGVVGFVVGVRGEGELGEEGLGEGGWCVVWCHGKVWGGYVRAGEA